MTTMPRTQQQLIQECLSNTAIYKAVLSGQWETVWALLDIQEQEQDESEGIDAYIAMAVEQKVNGHRY